MDRTESLTTAGPGQRSQFERGKERLVVEINQGMDAANRSLVQLNQNLESAISLSANFDRIARLWNEFGLITNPPAEDEDGNENDEAGTADQDGSEGSAYMDDGNDADTSDGGRAPQERAEGDGMHTPSKCGRKRAADAASLADRSDR
ncbi:hypothetical protein GGF46_003118 [Coemansia sp. RSA 552]|nr:hypothetical protein GGF46_003118 [Coemansia sp. RSA 552]